MPKLCKPTKEAILNRLYAVDRLNCIKHATRFYPGNEKGIVNSSVFGLKRTQKEGLLTIDDVINELKNAQ